MGRGREIGPSGDDQGERGGAHTEDGVVQSTVCSTASSVQLTAYILYRTVRSLYCIQSREVIIEYSYREKVCMVHGSWFMAHSPDRTTTRTTAKERRTPVLS